MVKGMTRRIVEIKDTGSGYFERAIFFVRLDTPHNVTEYSLSQEATKIIEKYSSDLQLGKPDKKQKFRNLIKNICVALAGAVAAVLVLKLCGLF